MFLHVLAGKSKMQDPNHSLPRSFLRVMFAASNYDRCSNVPPLTKSKVPSSFSKNSVYLKLSVPLL